MIREISNGEDARTRIKAGIDKAADTIKVTLGVKGRNVILDTNPYGNPINTNDGVTIAREIVLEDRFENIGAKLLKEVAGRTNDVAGDGTTTASVLMQAIVEEGNKAIIAGADAVAVRKGIEVAAETVISSIESETLKDIDLDTLISTAIISCGDPALGKLVAEVVHESGSDGIVTLEDNAEADTISEKSEGLKLRGGYIVPNYINVPELQQVALSGVPIFVTNQAIASAYDMAAIMQAALKLDPENKQVVVIANAIEGDALATSLKNWIDGKFYALPIRVMSYGDMGEGVLRDVAALTGATFFDSAANMSVADVQPNQLGTIEKIVVGRHDTTVVTNGDTEERVGELKAQLEATDREFERESLRERIAKLNNALFTIKVGGVTDTERQERKLRVEDAINACKAALAHGVVAGGGSALYRGSLIVMPTITDADEVMGFRAVLKACQAPIVQMALNASHQLDRSDLEQIVSNNDVAIDFKTGHVVDAFKSGIIDPVKVVTSALENAASGAALFLTTEAAVVLKDEPREEQI